MILKKFNLIEIALAIGILAVGLTSIVSLFPIGLQETRDSIGQNYSSETADSMLAYIAREAYNDWNVLASVPEGKPISSLTDSSGWTHLEGNIYGPDAGNGVYGLKVSSGDNDSITDFAGEVLLWKSKVQNIRAANEDIDELEYGDAIALHLEISWPIERNYSQRKKNTFYLELFNYDQ
jgi:hypothetical protein